MNAFAVMVSRAPVDCHVLRLCLQVTDGENTFASPETKGMNISNCSWLLWYAGWSQGKNEVGSLRSHACTGIVLKLPRAIIARIAFRFGGTHLNKLNSLGSVRDASAKPVRIVALDPGDQRQHRTCNIMVLSRLNRQRVPRPDTAHGELISVEGCRRVCLWIDIHGDCVPTEGLEREV
jgi:hypothetical protein